VAAQGPRCSEHDFLREPPTDAGLAWHAIETELPGMNPDVHLREYGLLRELLRRLLVAELESSRGTGRTSRLGCGAGAALDSLLAAHRVDRRGRCRLCRGRGWWGRRRVCLVFLKAHYWLRHSPGLLPAPLARELGIELLPLLFAAEPKKTPMRSGTTADPCGDPSLTPAVPHPVPPRGLPEAGWPDPDHGPSADPSPGPGVAGLLTGGLPWPCRAGVAR
jgi:hypothetical protein